VRELKVETGRRTQLLDVTERLAEFDGPRERTIRVIVSP
jgi:hypothetical protein